MKPSKKSSSALARRLKEYVDKSAAGMQCRRPGSQNRKKGFGVNGGSRRH